MSALYVMIPFTVFLAVGFVVTFIYLASKGQYDDLETPAHKILLDDEVSIPHATIERLKQ